MRNADWYKLNRRHYALISLVFTFGSLAFLDLRLIGHSSRQTCTITMCIICNKKDNHQQRDHSSLRLKHFVKQLANRCVAQDTQKHRNRLQRHRISRWCRRCQWLALSQYCNESVDSILCLHGPFLGGDCLTLSLRFFYPA